MERSPPFVRLPRNDGTRFDGSGLLIQPKFGLARGTVGTMAGKAGIQQDGADVAVVFQRLLRHRG